MLQPKSVYKFALAAILLVALWLLLAPVFAGATQVNPAAFTLGSLTVHWYGITMALGILGAAIICLRSARPKLPRIGEDELISSFVWIVAGGLIGARLLFVLLKWENYAADPITALYINEGGLSLHGALLGGLLATLIYSSLQKINWKILADTIVVGLPVGQAIGRFGNFFNQEAFGGATNLPWKMYISPELRPESLKDAEYFHPTFLYEAILLALLYLFLRHRLAGAPKPGQLTAIYLGGYSIIRFVTEFFRIDSDYLGSLSVAQWASLAILAWSIIWYYRTKPNV